MYLIVLLNSKAFKFINISLINLDKYYFRLWILIQFGIIGGLMTHFGLTEILINYLYYHTLNPFRAFIFLLDFLLNMGFILEKLGIIFLFMRIIFIYPFNQIYLVWVNYLEYVFKKIFFFINIIDKLFKKVFI